MTGSASHSHWVRWFPQPLAHQQGDSAEGAPLGYRSEYEKNHVFLIGNTGWGFPAWLFSPHARSRPVGALLGDEFPERIPPFYPGLRNLEVPFIHSLIL